MGKRKEIKFLCKDGQTREGRQDGVMFWIRKDQKREQDGLPCYYVAANDTKGKGRTVFTGDHEYFTLEDAKELCQQIMGGCGCHRASQGFPGQAGGHRDLLSRIAGAGAGT